MGHLAVDLDGTLTVEVQPYDGSIGEPVEEMIWKVRIELAKGRQVRIFTARAAHDLREIQKVRKWVQKHIGVDLPVVCFKTMETEEIWDNRARQVITNTGRFACDTK
jgi:hydroxymethylpyrimidine pyrophosphatase-like HAD family hydrolase